MRLFWLLRSRASEIMAFLGYRICREHFSLPIVVSSHGPQDAAGCGLPAAKCVHPVCFQPRAWLRSRVPCHTSVEQDDAVSDGKGREAAFVYLSRTTRTPSLGTHAIDKDRQDKCELESNYHYNLHGLSSLLLLVRQDSQPTDSGTSLLL